jgi:hypothetical protein
MTNNPRIPVLRFDPAKPFYALVLAYRMQMKAMMESGMYIAIYQLMKPFIESGYQGPCCWRYRDIVALQANAVFNAILGQPINITSEFQAELASKWADSFEGAEKVEAERTMKGFVTLIRSLDACGYDFLLGSKLGTKAIALEPNPLLDEGWSHFQNVQDQLLSQAPKNLLIVAYEIAKDYMKGEVGNSEPMWEFLRHARNAAAHNGKWNLLNGEPRHSAEWRSIRLDPSFHGKDLLGGSGTLGLADPIFLLWDIEQKYPGMTS